MKLSSRDRTLTVTIGSPGTGFTITPDEHVWFFDGDGNIASNIPPRGHQSAGSPAHCSGCAEFVVHNYGTP